VLYVGGYYWLSDGIQSSASDLYAWRSYPAQWLAVIYRPAAFAEGMITNGYAFDTSYNLSQEEIDAIYSQKSVEDGQP